MADKSSKPSKGKEPSIPATPPGPFVDIMTDTVPSQAPQFYQELGHTFTEWQWVETPSGSFPLVKIVRLPTRFSTP
jgi:hypothetical protein